MAGGAGAAPPFEDVTGRSGVRFTHLNGATGEQYFPEIMGAGGALFDYDGDGDLDLYLAQGHPLWTKDETGGGGRLYRNDSTGGEVRFTDVTGPSGLGRLVDGYGMGAATGDVDGDGDTDLYLTHFGPNQLLINQGDGTFRDATASARVGDPGWTTAATFVDVDGDGDLDLLSVNYVEYTPATHKRCRTKAAAPTYCSPSLFKPQPDRLYRNRGDGTFEDATAALGLDKAYGPGLGAVAADVDGDGRPDLYVANDGAPNQLWMNRGKEGFRDEALLSGAAVSAEGKPEASMGVAAEDFDQDGDLDLFMTHLDRETNTLYRNDGGLFTDATAGAGLATPSQAFTGFGTAWVDYDLDGDLDLIVVNGEVDAVDEQIRAGVKHPYAQRNQIFENVGNRYRELVGEAAGEPFRVEEVSRGVLVGDLDDDGDADLVVTQNGGPARVLRNVATRRGSWVGLRVVGRNGADALGARVALARAGDTTLHRRVHTDGSYASASDPRVLFGLGDAKPGTVTVTWPDGSVERFPAPPTGRYTTLTRGRGATGSQ